MFAKRLHPLFQPQPAIEVLDYTIALAGGLFENLAIQNPYRATRIFDQSGVLKDGGSQTHAGPAGAEHLREKFVRQGK